MPQVISKDNIIFCQTRINYDSEIVRSMKSAGYKIKTVDILPCDKEIVDKNNNSNYNEEE